MGEMMKFIKIIQHSSFNFLTRSLEEMNWERRKGINLIDQRIRKEGGSLVAEGGTRLRKNCCCWGTGRRLGQHGQGWSCPFQTTMLYWVG